MSSLRFRFILRELNVKRLWSAWTRNYLLVSVVKRCRSDRGVREVLQCFRQALLRPRRTLLLSATAAYKSHGDDEGRGPPASCDKSITDEELQALITELEGVEELSKRTLFCAGCQKRVLIDKKQPGVVYCACKDVPLPDETHNGWQPYMEAEDVIIWRKEYKPGQGLYAYKVYGRYKDVRAQDFAAVQVDGAYRRAWDSAVASLSVVEREANGVHDQTVLHWEVLWPRLFANRDYVYIRRHKEFDVKTKCMTHKDSLFEDTPCTEIITVDPPNVHSNAKRKAIEQYKKEERAKGTKDDLQDDKIYIIVSRSCQHSKVPESKHVIRVSEYWSHMVVKTIDGPDNTGMEFVLTYYDEPAVGGMPSAVSAWATGRAAPAYLTRMRSAAVEYRAWLQARDGQDLPDFTPFRPEKTSYEERRIEVREQDMESSKLGPDMENGVPTQDKSTQTDVDRVAIKVDIIENTSKIDNKSDKVEEVPKDVKQTNPEPTKLEEDIDKPEEEDRNSWWSYLYPFYYFV